MSKTYRLVFGRCCGFRCAKLIEEENGYKHVIEDAPSDFSDNWRWLHNTDPEKDAHFDWKMKLSAIKEALRRAVEHGKMTQEQADAELEKWLKENPDPEAPIDVTEVFGIPVKIKRQEEVEADR